MRDSVRNYLKGMRWRVRYAALRTYAQVSGYGLRGYEFSTPEYLERNGYPYRKIDGERFVGEIPRGHALLDYGVIAGPHRKLLADICPQLGRAAYTHDALQRGTLPQATSIGARVAVLSSTAHQRYYHWLFDILPRVGILRDAGATPDLFLANRDLKYQRETLEAVGIQVEQTLSPTPETHLVADALVVPSLPGVIGHPTRYAYEFLRSIFPETRTKSSRNLFVTRSDAASRRLINEADIIAQLRGFEVVALEGMSVAQQAALFSEASTIVAPHGAGLSNSVFCRPGTKIVELMPERFEAQCFEELARIGGFDFRRVLTKTANPETHDAIVPIEAVLKALV